MHEDFVVVTVVGVGARTADQVARARSHRRDGSDAINHRAE